MFSANASRAQVSASPRSADVSQAVSSVTRAPALPESAQPAAAQPAAAQPVQAAAKAAPKEEK